LFGGKGDWNDLMVVLFLFFSFALLEFFANSDLRPVLEAALTAQFVTLTKGTVLDLRHGSSVFPIRVADLSPVTCRAEGVKKKERGRKLISLSFFFCFVFFCFVLWRRGGRGEHSGRGCGGGCADAG
jgi:hypothetical protein